MTRGSRDKVEALWTVIKFKVHSNWEFQLAMVIIDRSLLDGSNGGSYQSMK